MSKRTPWYPSSVNPVRDGVYEWHCPFIYGGSQWRGLTKEQR